MPFSVLNEGTHNPLDGGMSGLASAVQSKSRRVSFLHIVHRAQEQSAENRSACCPEITDDLTCSVFLFLARALADSQVHGGLLGGNGDLVDVLSPLGLEVLVFLSLLLLVLHLLKLITTNSK